MTAQQPLHVYKVFLSSADTSDPEARAYRLAAKKLIDEEFRDKWRAVEMGEFDPADSSAMELCRKKVLECQVYIGILGTFYGCVTEIEYDVARENRRQTYIFELEEKAFTPTEYEAQRSRIDPQLEFRKRVRGQVTPARAKTLEEFPKQLRQFLLDLKIEDDPYDGMTYDRRLVDGYTIGDLDQDLVRIFLNQPLAQRALRNAGMTRASMQEHMEILGLVVKGRPTIGAFMCFAPARLLVNRYPACSLQKVVYDKLTRTESRADIRPDQGNLLDLFDLGMKFLLDDAGLRHMGAVGSRSRDDLEVPEIALREALANALVHRDYETPDMQNQPTRIEVFPDRIEITSYGTLVGGLDIATLNQDIEPRITLRRNKVIADIFMIMTNVELNGTGVNRMRQATRDAGLAEPEVSYGQ